MDYSFRIDADFAHAWNEANHARGLQSRTVAYHGFPIDVGSVVALKLLNPDNAIPAVIVSSNVYANRAETTVLAKACLDVLKSSGKKAVAVTAMSMSNRMFTEFIDASDDKIHSLKDDEWNRRCLNSLRRSTRGCRPTFSNYSPANTCSEGCNVQTDVVAFSDE